MATNFPNGLTISTLSASGAVSAASLAAVGAVTGASAAITGDVAAATATISGAISAASATLTGDVGAGTATITGAASAATVAATTGMTIGGAKVTPTVRVSVPLGIAANATTYTGILNLPENMTLQSAEVGFVAPPASTLGTVTLALTNYDAGGTADDNMLSTATVDLETATAKTPMALTLSETTADLDLEDGDFLYATVVSDNADMADGTGGVITVVLQPTDAE